MKTPRYSLRTGETYLGWVGRFLEFHQPHNPAEPGSQAITPFLSYLAMERNVAPATQNQAPNAIVFFYRHALRIPAGELDQFVHAKHQKRLPLVLTKDEMERVLKHLEGLPFSWADPQSGSAVAIPSRLRCNARKPLPPDRHRLLQRKVGQPASSLRCIPERMTLKSRTKLPALRKICLQRAPETRTLLP